MRVEPHSGPGGGDSDANELLRTLVSGNGAVDQSTREELQRLLSDGYAPAPIPANEPAPPPKPKPVALDSMEAKRLAGMNYVRRLRISAR